MRLVRQTCGRLIVLGASCVLWAQSQPHVQPARPEPANTRVAPQLINDDEGLAILGAALAGRYKVQDRSDCSHLVHAIYENAGFPYKYERSSDLYAGIDAFRQVWRPQPGDVVAWPGHAGIVVNPAQRTFYSALRSGFGVQPYDSVYWKHRGRPHFFRYVKAVPAPLLTATNRPSSVKKPEAPSGTAKNRSARAKADDAPEVVATHRTPSLQQAGLRNGAGATPAPAIAVSNAPLPEDPPVVNLPETPAIPAAVAIKTVRPKPEEVSAALLEQLRETGDALQSQDVFQLHSALVAFDRVQVQKVYMKGNSGWVDLRVLDTLALTGATSSQKKRGPVQRWNLKRAVDGWELGLPQDTIYVPRDSAARILAHQLAVLTESKSTTDHGRDQKAQLTRWLSMLLDDPSAR